MDKSRIVKTPHLKAGLEVWRYCFDSAKFVFQDRNSGVVRKKSEVGIAQRILALLENSANGMTRTEISATFNNHHGAEVISRALLQLRDRGIVDSQKEKTGGRAAERWFLTKKGEAQCPFQFD